MFRVIAQLVPESPDVDVDRPVEDLRLVLTVDRVEELVPGQDPSVGLEQGRQQPELDRGQRDVPAGDPDLWTRRTSSAGENGLGR
jgi:hypothetical protein